MTAGTLDDLLRGLIPKLLKSKNYIKPSRGNATELLGVLLELTNPRARLSLTESKGRLSSCLGELLWYLAKSKNLQFITYYLSHYQKESDDGRTVYGGYGPRLFGMRRINQVGNVIELLRKKRDSRRVVIQLFDAADIARKHKEIPCTCTLQFMIRGHRLHMFTNMRSNDLFLGLPHDFFAFTMLQEIIARTLRVEIGTYKHAVGSLHLYEEHRSSARQYLKEGWQSTTAPMPHMPTANPWPSLRKVVKAERAIRSGQQITISPLRLHPYWQDLVRLLQIYRNFKQNESDQIRKLRARMSVHIYDSYIDDLVNRLQNKQAERT